VGVFRNPYRPELYYMRGPGPKWHEKHSGLSQPGLIADEHREIVYSAWLIPAITAMLLGFAAVVALA
jgi:hypothetical protein